MRPARAAAAAALLLLAAALPARAGEAPPGDVAAAMRRQDAMVARGDADAAIAEARARVAREPRSPEALYLLGRVLGNTGKLDEARVQFEGALELDISYGRAWQGMAIVHLRQKDLDTASREARKAYDLDPSPEALVLLVNVLYEKGERAAAYRLIEERLARTPGDNDLRTFWATLMLQEGLLRDSERELRVVLANDPEHLAGRNALIMLLIDTGRRDEAAGQCREAIRRAPREPRLRIILRDLLVRAGDFAGAAAAMEEVLKLDIPPEERAKVEADVRSLRSAAAAPAVPAEPDPEEILRRLESPDVVVRRDTMRILWERPLAFLPDAAIKRVTDPDETIRIYAVRLLGRYGGGRAAGLLEVMLFHPRDRDPSLLVRTGAAAALGGLGTDAALPVLFRALEEPEPEVMRAAVQGIWRITGKALVEDPDALVPEGERAAVRERYRLWWMDDPTGRLWRRKAAEAVGSSGMRALAWYVVPWVQEEDPAMRAAMLDCMARLTGDPAWRGIPTGEPGERTAARDRAYAALVREPGPAEKK